MACKCGSERIAQVSAKCSDMCHIDMENSEVESDDYVPKDFGIGGGDYIRIKYCLDCGQIQGDFPLPETELEELQKEVRD